MQGGPLSSQRIRQEFAVVEDGFDKLPTLESGNGNKLVLVNSAGDALAVIDRAEMLKSLFDGTLAVDQKASVHDDDEILIADSEDSETIKRVQASVLQSDLASYATDAEVPGLASPDAVVVADAATIAWDVGAAPTGSVTLGGNRTLENPTNGANGRVYLLIVTQDATGSRTLAYGSAFDWGEAGEPDLSDGANDVTVLTFLRLGGEMKGISALKFPA